MRSARPKQYLRLRGRALIEHSLRTLLGIRWIEGVVVVLPAADREFARLPVARQRGVHRATGGPTRAESVLAGLAQVAELASGRAARVHVFVHDAARPCLAAADLLRLRDEASGKHGGLLAVPVTDTLKRAQDRRAAATVARRGLWRAQTPQLFRLETLREALRHSLARGIEITDEAGAMEARGYRPRLVEGSVGNIKVTYPDDLALAGFWLKRMENRR